MRSTGQPASSVPFRALNAALERDFREHVVMSDYRGRGEDAERAFRSRALAALVVRMKTECDARTAAMMIADGGDD